MCMGSLPRLLDCEIEPLRSGSYTLNPIPVRHTLRRRNASPQQVLCASHPRTVHPWPKGLPGAIERHGRELAQHESIKQPCRKRILMGARGDFYAGAKALLLATFIYRATDMIGPSGLSSISRGEGPQTHPSTLVTPMSSAWSSAFTLTQCSRITALKC